MLRLVGVPRTVSWLAVAGLFPLLVACAGDASQGNDEWTERKEGPATVLTSEGLDVFFPVHEATSGMDADRHGELVVSGAGCLRVKDGPDDPGVTPVWPSGYEPTNAGERIQILDRRGRVLVSGGDRVVVGGGAITKEQLEQAEADFMDGDVRRELFERCPGLYYLASSVELESRFEKRLDPY